MKNLNVRNVLSVATFAAALMSAATPSFADNAYLTVTGNITKGTNHKWTLTQAEFDALPQQSVSTTTSWTKGVHTFTGPLMRDIQKMAGSNSAMMNAIAIDDYAQKIPTADFTKYDVILANRMDGKPLSMDHYGPMWIIYPRDAFPRELMNPLTDGKFVWQVQHVDFK